MKRKYKVPSKDSECDHSKPKKSKTETTKSAPQNIMGQLMDEFRRDLAKAESDVVQLRKEANDSLQADLKRLKKRQYAGNKRRKDILKKYGETGDPQPVIQSTNALRANKAKHQSAIIDANQRESEARTEVNYLKNMLKGALDSVGRQGRS